MTSYFQGYNVPSNLNQYHVIATILDANTENPTDIPISYIETLNHEELEAHKRN